MTHQQKEIVRQLLIQAGYKEEKNWWAHHALKSAIMKADLFADDPQPSLTTADSSVLKDFAKWLDDERNKPSKGLWRDMSIWGKENALEIMLEKFLAQYSAQSLPESQESKGGEAEEYITQDQYRKMAEGLDKPALKLIKDAGVPFEKWADNIQALIQKELGLEKTIVYKRVTKK